MYKKLKEHFKKNECSICKRTTLALKEKYDNQTIFRPVGASLVRQNIKKIRASAMVRS